MAASRSRWAKAIPEKWVARVPVDIRVPLSYDGDALPVKDTRPVRVAGTVHPLA